MLTVITRQFSMTTVLKCNVLTRHNEIVFQTTHVCVFNYVRVTLTVTSTVYFNIDLTKL